MQHCSNLRALENTPGGVLGFADSGMCVSCDIVLLVNVGFHRILFMI
jgi:hypothetical protein